MYLVMPSGARIAEFSSEAIDQLFGAAADGTWRTGSFDAAIIDDGASERLVLSRSVDGRFMIVLLTKDGRSYLGNESVCLDEGEIENPNDELIAGGKILHSSEAARDVTTRYWRGLGLSPLSGTRWLDDNVEQIPLRMPGIEDHT